MNKSRRRSEKMGAGIILVPAAVAVFLSLFAAAAGAHADDITVISSVVDSTPSATPTQFVTLPIGSDAATAPILNILLTGLEPYSFVQVFAQSDPVLISSGFADKYGVYKAKANLPPNLEPGTHTIAALTQTKGETTASLKPLIHFAVSESGTVVKSSSGSGGGSTGGGSTGGGSGGGSTGGGSGGTTGGGSTGGGVTESPVATPQPSSNLSIGGVLLVGGVESSSIATYDPNGAPARVAVSVANNYSKSLSLVVSFSITNLFGQEVARIANYKVESLKPKENLLLSAQTSKLYQSLGGGAGIAAGLGLTSGGPSNVPGAVFDINAFSAQGNVYDYEGVQAFAKGGMFTNSVVNKPTLFPFAKGTGLMGEAGPEAIMPLTRDAQGNLGVRGGQHNNSANVEVVINNYSGEKATATESTDSKGNRKIEVIVGDLVASEIKRSGSATQTALKGSFGATPALVRR